MDSARDGDNRNDEVIEPSPWGDFVPSPEFGTIMYQLRRPPTADPLRELR
jgi:hypothetical protein